jgi:5'-phosphate synthase pdxT subunit
MAPAWPSSSALPDDAPDLPDNVTLFTRQTTHIAVLVGILALQGDFFAHASALNDLSVNVRYIRDPSDLDGIEGLVIPGGESTTMSLLVQSSGLYAPLAELLNNGLPVLATCAGVIMLSREIVDGRDDQISFEMLDLSIKRNGYGRQLQSFETDILLSTGSFHAIFIRAPRILKVGPDMEVLAAIPEHSSMQAGHNGVDVVMCRQGSILACTFHPELTPDRSVHSMFVDQMKRR